MQKSAKHTYLGITANLAETVAFDAAYARNFLRCMECQRGLAMKKVSVCLSVRLSVCQTRAL